MTALIVLTAAAAGAGCGGDVVGSNVVAKLDDQTLTFDQLSAPTDPSRSAFADGDTVRAETTSWVQEQIAAKLQSNTEAVAAAAAKLYPTAVADLQIFCPDVLPPAEGSQEAVDALVAQVEADGWSAVADSVEAVTQQSPSAPCQSLSGAPDALIGPLAAIAPGEYVAFADPDLGYGVVRLRPLDEVDTTEFLQAVAQADPDLYQATLADAVDLDVYVNPRVGTFSPSSQSVVPVG